MEDDKVKIELEVPRDQIQVRPVGGPGDSDAQKELVKTREELKKAKQELREEKKKSEEDESIVKQATGYEVGELVSAPLHPPEPDSKKRPVYGQVRSLIIGFALIPLALIAWPIFGGSVAISVALIGAALIALGVLVRI